MQTYTPNSCNISMKILENALHSSVREMLFFDLITLESRRKKDLGRFVLLHQPHSTDLAPRDFHLFLFFTKCSERQKYFRTKIRWKRLWKTSWTGSQLNFTWEESTLLVNVDSTFWRIYYWLKFIHYYSWMNYILLQQKLFDSNQ